MNVRLKRPWVWSAINTLAVTCTSISSFAEEPLSGQARAEAAGRGLIGSPAPAMVVHTIDGQSIDLSKLYGKKAVYLEFWATWCVPCQEQMPHLQQTHLTAGEDLAVIAVNIGFNDPVQDVHAFRRKAGLTMPIVVDDGSIAAAFNVRVTPQHVVIGRDGRIQYFGHLADARLDEALGIARMPPASKAARSRLQASTATSRYKVGDALPRLSAVTLDGHAFNAIDTKEKRPTVLVFLSPWCESYLENSRPSMATTCRQVREQVDVLASAHKQIRWLGVFAGLWAGKSEMSHYRDKYRPRIPLALDEAGVWFRSFQVVSVPTILIADAGGRIVKRVEGYDAALAASLQGLSSPSI